MRMDIDSWYERFGPGSRFVIWGCSDFAEQFVCSSVGKKIDIEYMVDIDPARQGGLFYGIPVYPPDKLRDDRAVKIIISNTYMGTRAKIVSSLESMGFTENEDFTYIEIAFSILSWKMEKKIVSQYAEVSTTTFCTLNCKNCTAYMPYITHRNHVPFDELVSGCDAYFKCVDYVGRFRLLGGEPLIYPRIADLAAYIGERYRDRIGELCIVTNGTVEISKELIAILKKHRITLFISNYSKSGHPLTSPQKYKALLHLLEQEEIRFHFSDSAKWLALGDPTADRRDAEAVLSERYSDCRHYCRSIVGDYLFMCATWAFAVEGGMYRGKWQKYIGEEIMDLNAVANMDKEERFPQWFKFDIEMDVPRGYLDFCRYCDGFGSKNGNFVKVGEQANRF